ncbi:RFESD protein, partial [Polyodon spathula]|nr:RFESD protein [Polyodon spathula]
MASTAGVESSLFVGKEDDIIHSKRNAALVRGRHVVVIYHEGEFYAMDMHCYPLGTPLQRVAMLCPSALATLGTGSGDTASGHSGRSDVAHSNCGDGGAGHSTPAMLAVAQGTWAVAMQAAAMLGTQTVVLAAS